MNAPFPTRLRGSPRPWPATLMLTLLLVVTGVAIFATRPPNIRFILTDNQTAWRTACYDTSEPAKGYLTDIVTGYSQEYPAGTRSDGRNPFVGTRGDPLVPVHIVPTGKGI